MEFQASKAEAEGLREKQFKLLNSCQAGSLLVYEVCTVPLLRLLSEGLGVLSVVVPQSLSCVWLFVTHGL